MKTLEMRFSLPSRRKSWTQRVTIGGQTCYLNVGEYADGKPGEIFLDVSKQGTFTNGVLDVLARAVSIGLQCGADLEFVIKALQHTNYPPNGDVYGSDNVKFCTSVTDWVAQEIIAYYNIIVPDDEVEFVDKCDDDKTNEKVAGYISELWRSGA